MLAVPATKQVSLTQEALLYEYKLVIHLNRHDQVLKVAYHLVCEDLVGIYTTSRRFQPDHHLNSKHAWISSRPLNRFNVHTRCNISELGPRLLFIVQLVLIIAVLIIVIIVNVPNLHLTCYEISRDQRDVIDDCVDTWEPGHFNVNSRNRAGVHLPPIDAHGRLRYQMVRA